VMETRSAEVAVFDFRYEDGMQDRLGIRLTASLEVERRRKTELTSATCRSPAGLMDTALVAVPTSR
jgi:hypothetical protein